MHELMKEVERRRRANLTSYELAGWRIMMGKLVPPSVPYNAKIHWLGPVDHWNCRSTVIPCLEPDPAVKWEVERD
jgi:hypothetical protein